MLILKIHADGIFLFLGFRELHLLIDRSVLIRASLCELVEHVL